MITRALTLGLTLFMVLGLIACKGRLTTQITLSQAEIQTKVAGKFPIKRAQNDINITLSDPRVKLDGSTQRLNLTTTVLVQLPSKSVGPRGRTVNPPALTGQAVVDGDITYDKGAGTVSFEKGKLVSLKIDQLPPELSAKVQAMAGQEITAKLAKIEIFKLDEAKLEHAAAKQLLQSIKVSEGQLDIEVGYASE